MLRLVTTSWVLFGLTMLGCSSSADPEPDTFVPLPPPPAMCPPTVTGAATGQVPLDAMLKDCDGNDVALHSLCGHDAVWIYRYHRWCEACIYVIDRLVEQRKTARSSQSYASWVVAVEDELGGPATANTCKSVRDEFRLTVKVLYDPVGRLEEAVQWETDDNRDVVFGRGMVLRYKGETRVPEEVDKVLERLLGPP
ncbi:MAG: hypothetical protein ACI9OJ_001304 [Myxococcota bacterium]|jgi:hypothetical protein